jgi:hypothetical protein
MVLKQQKRPYMIAKRFVKNRTYAQGLVVDRLLRLGASAYALNFAAQGAETHAHCLPTITESG